MRARRKILYSPGFGAGWVSWAYDVGLRRFMLEYAPFIEALESADEHGRGLAKFEDGRFGVRVPRCLLPLLPAFITECKERFGCVPYLGGLRDIEVYEVDDGVRVRIEEYDGAESVVTEQGDREWI